MVEAFIQQCLDAPLNKADRINKIWLPKGKRSADTRTTEQRAAASAEARVKKEANAKRCEAKREQLLDYYATTQTPVARVAEHVGIKVTDAIIALKKRGRTC